MGLFSGSKQSSVQHNFSGLRGHDMTNYYTVANRVPGDFDFQIKALQDRASNSGNILGLSGGLMPQQTALMSQVGGNLFANLGLQNGMSPELMKSAMLNMGPEYLNMLGSNTLANANLADNRFTQLNQAMGNIPAFLGSNVQGTSSGSGPGLGYHVVDNFTQGYVKGLTGGGGGGGFSGAFGGGGFGAAGG